MTSLSQESTVEIGVVVLAPAREIKADATKIRKAPYRYLPDRT